MITISQNTKYFPEASLPFWEKKRCFSGLWEQVEHGKYLPIVVIDGENRGTDGDQEEISQIRDRKCYLIAGCPAATYIGCRETERSTFLYWRDNDGNYYEDLLGVMEVERCAQEHERRNRTLPKW